MEDDHYCSFELHPSWKKMLQDELKKPYIANISAFLDREIVSGAVVYPPKELIFNAFWKTPYDQVKVVIVGQDPYHGPGQAHGLSFSVPEGVTPPPSLKNIFKEIHSDLGISEPKTGCLLPWAEQGVMLLNATLTVRKGEPNSHHGQGWELFTDAVISKLAEREDPLVIVLWGKFAQKKFEAIPHLHLNTRHLVLTSSHPSPYSANGGFLGCKHFSKINNFLTKSNKQTINWRLS